MPMRLHKTVVYIIYLVIAIAITFSMVFAFIPAR
jgi:hypothetical protein